MEMTVMEEEVLLTHRSLEVGSVVCHAGGPHGEAPGLVRRSKGKTWQGPLCGSSRRNG